MERGQKRFGGREITDEKLGSGIDHSSIYKPPGLAILPVPMTVLINILLGFYVFVASLMILVILMQRPKSEGLGAAFGGGVTENIFGAQTTNVLTKITSWLAAIFFLMTFGLSILYAHKAGAPSTLKTDLMKGEPTPAPGATPVATPAGAAAAATSATPGASQSPESSTPSAVSTETPSAETPTPAATATPVPATPAPQPTVAAAVAATPAPEPTVSAADSSAASATPGTHRRRRHR